MSDNRMQNTTIIVRKKKDIGYVIGSLALFAAACVVIPLIMPKAAGMLYKRSITTNKHDEDDWGPVIERKGEH